MELGLGLGLGFQGVVYHALREVTHLVRVRRKVRREVRLRVGSGEGEARNEAQGEAQGETQGEAQGETQGEAQGETQDTAQGEDTAQSDYPIAHRRQEDRRVGEPREVLHLGQVLVRECEAVGAPRLVRLLAWLGLGLGLGIGLGLGLGWG